MRHTDAKRKHGEFCATLCFLCAAAIRLRVMGKRLSADAILKPSGPDVRLHGFRRGALGGLVASFLRLHRK